MKVSGFEIEKWYSHLIRCIRWRVVNFNYVLIRRVICLNPIKYKLIKKSRWVLPFNGFQEKRMKMSCSDKGCSNSSVYCSDDLNNVVFVRVVEKAHKMASLVVDGDLTVNNDPIVDEDSMIDGIWWSVDCCWWHNGC